MAAIRSVSSAVVLFISFQPPTRAQAAVDVHKRQGTLAINPQPIRQNRADLQQPGFIFDQGGHNRRIVQRVGDVVGTFAIKPFGVYRHPTPRRAVPDVLVVNIPMKHISVGLFGKQLVGQLCRPHIHGIVA